jgi:hypothetical protein
LTLEGPARTMRGAPARHCDLSSGGRCTWRVTTGPGQLAERIIHGALRRGARCGGVRGIGAAGSARDGALSRKRKRARLPAICGESPKHPSPPRRGTPGLFTLSVLGLRIPREFRRGPVGPARRRCALEAFSRESCNSSTRAIRFGVRESDRLAGLRRAARSTAVRPVRPGYEPSDRSRAW